MGRVGKVQSSNGCRSKFIPAGSQFNLFQTDRFTVRDQNWSKVWQKIAPPKTAPINIFWISIQANPPRVSKKGSRPDAENSVQKGGQSGRLTAERPRENF